MDRNIKNPHISPSFVIIVPSFCLETFKGPLTLFFKLNKLNVLLQF